MLARVEEGGREGEREKDRQRERERDGPTFLTLMPAVFSPFACLFLSSVTTEIGLRPAFSASVDGITSMASAKALMQ